MARIPGAIGRGYLPKGGVPVAIRAAALAGEKWRCRSCNKSGLRESDGGLCKRCKKKLHIHPPVVKP